MKYSKKPKYGFDLKKLRPAKEEEDITLEEFYKEQLSKKAKNKRLAKLAITDPTKT